MNGAILYNVAPAEGDIAPILLLYIVVQAAVVYVEAAVAIDTCNWTRSTHLIELCAFSGEMKTKSIQITILKQL